MWCLSWYDGSVFGQSRFNTVVVCLWFQNKRFLSAGKRCYCFDRSSINKSQLWLIADWRSNSFKWFPKYPIRTQTDYLYTHSLLFTAFFGSFKCFKCRIRLFNHKVITFQLFFIIESLGIESISQNVGLLYLLFNILFSVSDNLFP